MAAITAKMVKDLREETGAGMMECKKALTETDGDMEAAVEFLRKNGQAKAEKRANKVAAEGLCDTVVEGNTAAIVEVNSETDFVAKNETFQEFVSDVAQQAIKSDASDVDALLSEKWIKDESKTVKEALVDKIAVIGENLTIRRFAKLTQTEGKIVSYIHGGGRIAVLVSAKVANVTDGVTEALTNVAMQVAAMNPKYIRDSDVDQAYIDHETEIIRAQIENNEKEASKPEKVKEGMIKGRISKELKEVCLLDQVYVKAEDGKQTVGKYLEAVAKAENTSIEITDVVRFETGEGIEKAEEDFAAEVAAQLK